MILVNHQNLTNNLIIDLLRYKISDLWRVVLWFKVLQSNQNVLIRTLIPIQTLLSTLPGVGSRPCQNTPGDPRVKKTNKTEWLTLSEWRCPLNNGPKMADRRPIYIYIYIIYIYISILELVRVSSSNFLRMFVLLSC